MALKPSQYIAGLGETARQRSAEYLPALYYGGPDIFSQTWFQRKKMPGGEPSGNSKKVVLMSRRDYYNYRAKKTAGPSRITP